MTSRVFLHCLAVSARLEGPQDRIPIEYAFLTTLHMPPERESDAASLFETHPELNIEKYESGWNHSTVSVSMQESRALEEFTAQVAGLSTDEKLRPLDCQTRGFYSYLLESIKTSVRHAREEDDP